MSGTANKIPKLGCRRGAPTPCLYASFSFSYSFSFSRLFPNLRERVRVRERERSKGQTGVSRFDRLTAPSLSRGAPGYNGGQTHGFTLLEILIALAVSAIVLLAIQTVFFGALRLHKTTTDQLATSLSLERTLAIVQHDVEGLMLPGSTLSGELQTTPMSSFNDSGLGDRIGPDFYTSSGNIDGWNPFSEVQRVTYYLAPATDGTANKNLVRAVSRNLLPTQDTTSESQPLLEGVAQATFSYYDGTTWMDTWDSTATATLPTAIKLSLLLAPPSGQALASDPIELVVPVLVATTTSQTQSTTGATP